jgi:hypothetical protein
VAGSAQARSGKHGAGAAPPGLQCQDGCKAAAGSPQAAQPSPLPVAVLPLGAQARRPAARVRRQQAAVKGGGGKEEVCRQTAAPCRASSTQERSVLTLWRGTGIGVPQRMLGMRRIPRPQKRSRVYKGCRSCCRRRSRTRLRSVCRWVSRLATRCPLRTSCRPWTPRRWCTARPRTRRTRPPPAGC